MRRRAPLWLGVMITAVLAVVYAYLAHLSNTSPELKALGVTLTVAPLIVLSTTLIWRSTHRATALLTGLLALALTYRYWTILKHHYSWLYLVQQAGVYGLLGLTFGRSLSTSRVPLCTQWATRLHGELPPLVHRYTRSVTVAWTVFFWTLSAGLIIVFLVAPLPVWSAFANFCALPLVITMFVGEYLIRRRILPDTVRTQFIDSLRAYFSAAQATAPTARD